MLYLAGNEFPTTREQLITAIEGGLKRVIPFPAGGLKVTADGAFPNLDTLQIDLTGAQIDPANPPPKPQPTGQIKPGITVASLALRAKPLRVGPGAVTLDLTAHNVRFDFDRDVSGALLLVPAHVADGNVSVEITHADLGALALEQAREMASQQGAKISSLVLTLSPRGPRSVAFEAKAGVKKFFVSGLLRFLGQIDIDDQLVARISGLDVKGEGLAMSIAEGMIRSKLKQVEGKQIALASFTAAGLRLRDVTIDPADPVRIKAAFGE
jgi:hypothetical protein